MYRNLESLVFSMFTAGMTAGIVALFGIWGLNFLNTTHIAPEAFADGDESENTALLEEGEQDPSFISRFSRVSIYSADDGREVIESARDSLPLSKDVKVTADAYVVMDMDRGVVVLEKNSNKTLPIASITKLVTAVISKKLMDENHYVSMTSSALSAYGNEARLREGEKLRVKELFYPLLMVSSNDSSEVLAREYGRKSFIQEMNDWVGSIGAYHTYFADPSGLSPNNISTAEDLATITKWIIENEPGIFAITLEKAKTVRTHTWVNPTHFLNLASYAGGKNGYTPEADRTSVALFKLGKQERLYSVILLGSSSRDNDILELLDEAVG